MEKPLTNFSTEYPKVVTIVIVAITLLLALWAAIPSIWPDTFPRLHSFKIDTDPENMLSAREPIRVFHNMKKKEMSLYDMVVVGIVNDRHPQGVFNPASLNKVYEITEFAKTLTWPDPDNPGQKQGVIEAEILAPSTVDNIEQDAPGSVRFEWLMPSSPKTQSEAVTVGKKAARISLFNGNNLLIPDLNLIAHNNWIILKIISISFTSTIIRKNNSYFFHSLNFFPQ